jgi:hypothetical protein
MALRDENSCPVQRRQLGDDRTRYAHCEFCRSHWRTSGRAFNLMSRVKRQKARIGPSWRLPKALDKNSAVVPNEPHRSAILEAGAFRAWRQGPAARRNYVGRPARAPVSILMVEPAKIGSDRLVAAPEVLRQKGLGDRKEGKPVLGRTKPCPSSRQLALRSETSATDSFRPLAVRPVAMQAIRSSAPPHHCPGIRRPRARARRRAGDRATGPLVRHGDRLSA